MNNQVEIKTRKPLGLNLNNEMASLLIRGLNELPETDKRTITYNKLKKELDLIIQIWDRRIKNEKIVQGQKRQIASDKKKARQTPQ